MSFLFSGTSSAENAKKKKKNQNQHIIRVILCPTTYPSALGIVRDLDVVLYPASAVNFAFSTQLKIGIREKKLTNAQQKVNHSCPYSLPEVFSPLAVAEPEK